MIVRTMLIQHYCLVFNLLQSKIFPGMFVVRIRHSTSSQSILENKNNQTLPFVLRYQPNLITMPNCFSICPTLNQTHLSRETVHKSGETLEDPTTSAAQTKVSSGVLQVLVISSLDIRSRLYLNTSRQEHGHIAPRLWPIK